MQFSSTACLENVHVSCTVAGKISSHMSRDGFYGIDQSATSAGLEYTIRVLWWVECVPGPLKRGQEKCSCPLLSDCGPPSQRVFFYLRFCRTWTKRYLITSQTRVKCVSQINHWTILKSNNVKKKKGKTRIQEYARNTKMPDWSCFNFQAALQAVVISAAKPANIH